MENKKFFETTLIEVTETVKEYLPLLFLIGNMAFCSIVATYVVKAVAINYVGIELGKTAVAIHSIWIGTIIGIWLSSLLLHIKNTLESFLSGENTASACEAVD